LAQSSQHAANTAILVVGVILATVGLGASGVVVMNLGAELFPTPIRATSEGFAVGSNKLGAYIGTLVVPNILHTFKVTGLMVVVLGVVLVASVLMALIPIEPARQPLKQSGLLGSEPVMEEEYGA
jgi:MFS family permease